MNPLPAALVILVALVPVLGPSDLFAQRPAAPVPSKRPNIVLIMCDDLGWADVGFNGNRVIRTPHLDQMAREGLKLTRFYAAAPVCSPTRGSCLTGRHPFRYGIFFANTGHLPPPEMTLAELLAAEGYATGHFGKWHLGTLTRTEKDSNRGGPKSVQHYSPPPASGFQVCFSTEAKVPTWDPMIRPKGAGKTWWDPVLDRARATTYGTAYWNEHGQRVTENLEGDDSRVIMDRVIPFIGEAADRGQPFFAVVWFHAPHLPVVAGPDYTALYAQYDNYARHYFGCVTALDEQVGRLRDQLRRLNLAENTLITFCSDNGPEGKARDASETSPNPRGAPGSAGLFRGRKRSLYEGGIRVPAVIAWPAVIQPGSTSDMPAVTSDYLPTILQIVGVSLNDQRPLDGISLLPLMRGEMHQRPRPIGFQSRNQAALIDNQYKIYTSTAGKPGEPRAKRQFELYDLLQDPSETTDLAEEHPEVVAKMAATLNEWRRSCARSLAGDDFRSAP